MRAGEILRFSWTLFHSRLLRSFLIVLSLGLSIAIVFLFLSFAKGAGETVLHSFLQDVSANEVLVFRQNTPQKGIFRFGKTGLGEKELENIRNIPHVSSASPEMPLLFPNSVTIPLGLSLNIDMFFFGVDTALLPSFEDPEEGILPVFLNPKALDIYNSSLAEMIPGISQMTPEQVLGTTIDIEFGKSSFLPDFSAFLGTKSIVKKKGRVMGFSTKSPILGFSIPLDTAENISEEVFGERKPDSEYSRISVFIQDASRVEGVQQELEKKGFFVRNAEELGGKVRAMVLGFRVVIFALGVAILLIALFSLLAILIVSLLEQVKTIGILRSLGASRKTILGIFWGEIFFFLLFSLFLGLVSGATLAHWCNVKISGSLTSSALLQNNVFFDLSPSLFFLLGGGVISFAFLFTLFPILRASKKDPMVALWG